ncbi:MAG: DsrE family protein [Aigarchaeota archaeon]|nr:DsrE family protein [Candidatus Pelearchaeum maunauluense]
MTDKLLIIILSDHENYERARQGLRVARKIKRGNMLSEVKILFLGPGVKLLDKTDARYSNVEHFLKEYQQLGITILACAGNIRAYGLEEKIDRTLVIEDDAATVVAENVSKNYNVISF